MFKDQLLAVVSQGLSELEQSQSRGKVPKNALSESHFFSVWVGQSMKQKRFDISVLEILKTWQQQARTMGAGANLRQVFLQLNSTYANLSHDKNIGRGEVDLLLAALTNQDWQVATDVVVTKKMSMSSQGLSSIVICANEYERAFSKKGQLHCYVRGQQQEFIDACYELGILVFKVTDYKSAVKFHGEFILDTANNHNQLAQIPTKYHAN